jgi:hypothetical protein
VLSSWSEILYSNENECFYSDSVDWNCNGQKRYFLNWYSTYCLILKYFDMSFIHKINWKGRISANDIICEVGFPEALFLIKPLWVLWNTEFLTFFCTGY